MIDGNVNEFVDHIQYGDADNYPVNSFLEAPIFNGKIFYEVEKDIKWVDC